MKKRQTWEEVKKAKEKAKERMRRLGLGGNYPNAKLLEKAVKVAEEFLKHKFVSSVGIFGSTSREETGRDIDLIVIDDGTISDPALEELQGRSSSLGFSSGGAYANICYNLFAKYVPGERTGQFYNYLRERPCAIDLVFVGRSIQWSQDYLDELTLNGNDPFFFRNIMEDALLFCLEIRKFHKSKVFPGFVNSGAPSQKALHQIMEEMSRSHESKLLIKNLTLDNKEIVKKNIETATVPQHVPQQTTEVIRFDSIGGQLHAKSEVMSLSAALNNPERYQRWGTKPPRGICLYGPPGTGKTLLAKALATEIKVPFYPVDASQLMSKWYGEAEKNIDRTFEAVRKTGGILFFDEADSLASSRSAPHAHEVTKRVVAALCRNMDGFKTLDKVVVFFATNRLEDMDPAVIRPGRIDRIIEVPLPDREGRREIFGIHLRSAEQIASRKLFENLDIESLLDKTDEYSGADIAEIIRRVLEAKVREEDSGRSPGLVTTGDILQEISSYERVKKNRQAIGFSRE